MSKDVKRGRLQSVETRPMYDEKGKITGHTVAARHEPAEKAKDGFGGPYPAPVESPHETMESAAKMHQQHLEENEKEYGGSKRGRSMKDAIGSA